MVARIFFFGGEGLRRPSLSATKRLCSRLTALWRYINSVLLLLLLLSASVSKDKIGTIQMLFHLILSYLNNVNRYQNYFVTVIFVSLVFHVHFYIVFQLMLLVRE